MARAQGGSSAKFVWPLVIFGAGFVICLLLAIIFYTQLTEARTQLSEAESSLNDVAGSQVRSAPAYTRYQERGGSSIAATMLEDVNALKQMIGVSNDTPVEQIKAQMSELPGAKGATFLERVRQLNTNLTSTDNELQSVRSQLKQARDQMQKLQQQKQSMAKEFKQARQKLQEQYGSQQQFSQQVQSRLDQMRQKLTQQMSQSRQKLQEQIASLEKDKEQLAQKNKELQTKVDNLLSRPGPADVGAQVARPDGRVTSVLGTGGSGPQRAYINLGRQDQLRLGTTFEVYESGSLVEVSSLENQDAVSGDDGQVIRLSSGEDSEEAQSQQREAMRGKATVEVFQVDESSSMVRVVRSDSADPLSEGDVLVNLIYAPDREVVFHVFGEFDINGDDEYTSQDRERLKSLIREWGGQVAETFSYQVDFLVLGRQPNVPQEGAQQTNNPEQIKSQAAAKKRYNSYQQLVQEARKLHIPVLNQTRFLTMIGYYER